MSLATNVTNLATAIATEVKRNRTWINGNGVDLSALDTTAKTNLVDAINEVVAAVTGASGIDDGTTGTTTSWSSSKTQDEIDAAIAAIVLPVLTDLIDDAAAASDTVYSSTKTDGQIAAAIAALPDFTDLIDDATPGSDTVYSSTKTNSQIAAAVAALVGDAPVTLDTINELAAALADSPDTVSGITTALGNRLRFDASQTLDGTQKTQGLTNLGAAAAGDLSTLTTNVGTTTTDFAAAFAAGLT